MVARSRPARLLAGLVLVVVGAAGVVACGGDDADRTLAGIVREPAPQVGEVTLPEASNGGTPFRTHADDGELLLVYFGYTSCPDVCPTTMADVRVALADLGEDADRVEVAMVTVDPERDTDERLTAYVQSFVDGAIALRTTDDAALRAAADAYGASYDVATNDDGEIEVAHTGFLYAVDDAGQLLVTWPFPTPADDLAHDMSILLAG